VFCEQKKDMVWCKLQRKKRLAHMQKQIVICTLDSKDFTSFSLFLNLQKKSKLANSVQRKDSFFEMGITPQLMHHDDAHGHLLKRFKFGIVLQLKHNQELIQKSTSEKSTNYSEYTSK
jgi:hypothetical protein